MIITKLIGGLGNQMFQYAAGLSLARRCHMPLRVDITSLREYRLHQGYQFDEIFKGDVKIANRLDLFRVLGFGMGSAVKGSVAIAPNRAVKKGERWLRQRTHNFWPPFDLIDHPCYLAGYLQSPRYFADVEDEVRTRFSFRTPLQGKNKEIASRISNCDSVCLHVRRGDYVSNPAANQFHGICDWDYYERALAFIAKQRPDLRVFVFSDAPEEVHRQFSGNALIEVVDPNTGLESYRDMQLMALCRHHIIANSSFSWWAAWLGKKEGQIVVAPKIWFAGSDESMEDIYCPEWHSSE